MGVVLLPALLAAVGAGAAAGIGVVMLSDNNRSEPDVNIEIDNRDSSWNRRSRRSASNEPSRRVRRRSSERHDDDSSSKIDEQASHNIARHIVARLRRWFRFGGVLHGIHDDTNISRNDIVEAEGSVYQDRTSRLGREIHAAHVVRAGRINSMLRQISSRHFRGLRDFIGHTQNVFWANVGGVARGIDEFQTNEMYLELLHQIDFSTTDLTSERDEKAIKTLVKEYLKMLLNYANNTSNETLRDAIQEAMHLIIRMPRSDFHKAGRKGYSGDYERWRR